MEWKNTNVNVLSDVNLLFILADAASERWQ